MSKIFFSELALDVFVSQTNKFGTIETGGVLMGHVGSEGIFIEVASDPGPKAIHESVYFKADPNYIDLFIDMNYANSHGKCVYLGEWHTHPQVIPEPSSVDLISLEEISDTAEEFAILVILGAVGFTKKNFLTQSTAIIKFKDEEKFYHLDTRIDGKL